MYEIIKVSIKINCFETVNLIYVIEFLVTTLKHIQHKLRLLKLNINPFCTHVFALYMLNYLFH